VRLTPEQYGKLGRPGEKAVCSTCDHTKGDIRVSKYRFIFSVGDKPDLQGYVDFPEGEVPHFPQTNNEVNCASNYGQEIKGVVQDISFHYDLEKSGSEPGGHMTELIRVFFHLTQTTQKS
jgi:hypothetical protein